MLISVQASLCLLAALLPLPATRSPAPASGAVCTQAHSKPVVPFRTRKLPRSIRLKDALDLGAIRDGHALTADSSAAALAAMSAAQRAAWASFVGAMASASARADRPPAEAGAFDARLLVLGGSMLAGGGCDQPGLPRWSPGCTYSKRFLDALARYYRAPGARAGARVDFVSLASGGTTTEGVLPSLPAQIGQFGDEAEAGVPTLLLVDYSVNDAWEFKETRDVPRLRAATEALLRYVLRSHPRIALLLVETYPGRWAAQPNAVPPAYEVAAAYGVAHVRYSRVVREWARAWGAHCGLPAPAAAAESERAAGAQPSSARALRGASECAPHPAWTTHQMIADALLFTVIELGRAVCGEPPRAADAAPPRLRPPVSPASLLSRAEVCERPTAQFHADASRVHLPRGAAAGSGGGAAGSGHGAAKGPRVRSGNWTLYADRVGKPGWITTGPPGSSLEFDLAFGAAPRVTLTYLRGYDEALGTVELRMKSVRMPLGADGAPRPLPRVQLWRRHHARLRALRSDGVRVSQTAVLAIKADDERMQNFAMDRTWTPAFSGVIGFGIPPYSRATLSITLPCERCNCTAPAGPGSVGRGCKFKVLAVVAC